MDEDSPKDSNEEDTQSKPAFLTVNRSSVKSRSSNCLMDPSITPWLPGLNLAENPASGDEGSWTNFRLQQSRPSRDDGGSSQSNSNFVTSDKQRLKQSSSRRKKRGVAKKQSRSLSGMEKGKEDDQLSPLGRKVIVFVAVFLFLLCILLVGVTLRLGPVIDEMVRKGNEEIYRSMSAGASTSSPTTEDAVVANNTTPSSGTPG